MSNLVEHAKRELSLMGNGEEFNNSIIKSIEAFAEFGHSGTSAQIAIGILHDLLEFKNLTGLTNDPDEWNHISEELSGDGDLWQSQRNPAAFSKDGGKTYYLLTDRDGDRILPMYTSEEV